MRITPISDLHTLKHRMECQYLFIIIRIERQVEYLDASRCFVVDKGNVGDRKEMELILSTCLKYCLFSVIS